MADQELVEECTGKLDRVMARTVAEHFKREQFDFPGKTKKMKDAAKEAYGNLLKGFMLSGVQIAVHALLAEDGRVNPHILGEAVKGVADKLRMDIVPVKR